MWRNRKQNPQYKCKDIFVSVRHIQTGFQKKLPTLGSFQKLPKKTSNKPSESISTTFLQTEPSIENISQFNFQKNYHKYFRNKQFCQRQENCIEKTKTHRNYYSGEWKIYVLINNHKYSHSDMQIIYKKRLCKFGLLRYSSNITNCNVIFPTVNNVLTTNKYFTDNCRKKNYCKKQKCV